MSNAEIILEHQHLQVEIPGDDYPVEVRLSQIDFSGNESVIQIHKSQVRQLAEAVGVLGVATSKSVAVPLSGGDQMHSLEVEQCDDGHIWIMQTRVSGMGGSDEGILILKACLLIAMQVEVVGGYTHDK